MLVALSRRNIVTGARCFSAQASLPSTARIVEVGPRDGLQNEKTVIPLDVKLELIRKLSHTGLTNIESGAFVSPKWVPQMADASDIFHYIRQQKAANKKAATFESSGEPELRTAGISFSALTPNVKGLESALMSGGVDEVAVFGAASEAFSQKNINCSIAESLQRFEPVARMALDNGIKVRGYVSCILGCPYTGDVPAEKVEEVTLRLLDMGCYEISLGDTIGVGTAGGTQRLLSHLLNNNAVQKEVLAVHFHDTYGQALANIYIALQHGINVIDSSVSGLGGCPYAAGASGNVATEDVLYMLHGLGIETGVDMEKMALASEYIDEKLGRQTGSKVAAAFRSIRAKNAAANQ